MIFEQLLEPYLREMAGRRRSGHTLRGERLRLLCFLDFCSRQSLLAPRNLTYEHFAAYERELADNAPSTRYLKLSTVARWLRWAHHRDHILHNPLCHWKRPVPAAPFRWVPTPEQMLQLIQSAPDPSPLRFLLEFLYGIGLRVAEASAVDLDDLDLQHGRLHVRQGKGQKPRYLPIGERLLQLCRHYVQDLRPVSACQALLLHGKGGRMQPWTLSKRVHQAGVAAGFPQLSVHSIRHAFALHLILNGAPLSYVRELLGHTNFQATHTYTQLVPSDVQAAVLAHHPRAKRSKSTPPPDSATL